MEVLEAEPRPSSSHNIMLYIACGRCVLNGGGLMLAQRSTLFFGKVQNDIFYFGFHTGSELILMVWFHALRNHTCEFVIR